jgi:hypothetical protein
LSLDIFLVCEVDGFVFYKLFFLFGKVVFDQGFITCLKEMSAYDPPFRACPEFTAGGGVCV